MRTLTLGEKLGASGEPVGCGFTPAVSGPVQIWSSATGLASKMKGRWSNYYENKPRQADRVFDLASYADNFFRKTDPRANVVEPDFSWIESDEI